MPDEVLRRPFLEHKSCALLDSRTIFPEDNRDAVWPEHRVFGGEPRGACRESSDPRLLPPLGCCIDLSRRLGNLAARGTLIGHVCRCQDLGMSWKLASNRAGCVEGSPRGLDKHLSDRSLWADCHFAGR